MKVQLWLLLCYSQYWSQIIAFEDISARYPGTSTNWMVTLPINLGVDPKSGCLCRQGDILSIVVCFGGYLCKRFPSVKVKTEILRVRTSVIETITVGELDAYYYLSLLEIDANHRLRYIEPGSFKNLTNLRELSLSTCSAMKSLDENIFKGLINLKKLSMVNNGFTTSMTLMHALRPNILPALEDLDLSENFLENLDALVFAPMKGSKLSKLKLNLCQIEAIHPYAFTPLRNLKELNIGGNEMNTSIIESFLLKLVGVNIKLESLDLTAMSFRRHPPRRLLEIIANTTIKRLVLAKNQFESIEDDSFPLMKNIEIIDLSKVSAFHISTNAFSPNTFPNLRDLYLNGNYLHGVHNRPIQCYQLKLLDLSNNAEDSVTSIYFEIESDMFLNCKDLEVLNLSYNRIKSVNNYTFRGLEKLEWLNMENGTIYHIGWHTFKETKHLKILNLANNYLTASANFSKQQFVGLSELKILNLNNCGIKFFDKKENVFEMMPNLTYLSLKNNQLFFITREILKPLKFLKVLDLSENFLVTWSKPLFFNSNLGLEKLLLTNNKISHFSLGMLEDMNYLLKRNRSTALDFMGNIFICDCRTMYASYAWIMVNATKELKNYFTESNFVCSTPDFWEDRKVVEYLESMKNLSCVISAYDRFSNVMIYIWTTPSIVLVSLVVVVTILIFRFRMYIKYWLFLAKLALSRRLNRNDNDNSKTVSMLNDYKYDAFISYSNGDKDFVFEMLHQLESNPPHLKLCVYERDFEIGSFISESILSSITESKFIILVISNGFAKSQWCRWETQLAEYHRIFSDKRSVYDPLILIRIGEIERKYITTTLKYLLKTKIYLQWDPNNSQEFWKKLRNALVKR